MNRSSPKPKLRWWQFSLRKFLVAMTLFTVLAVGFWRVREWGKELAQQRDWLKLERMGATWMMIDDKANREQYRKIGKAVDVAFENFNRKYWVPLKVYELTSSYDPRKSAWDLAHEYGRGEYMRPDVLLMREVIDELSSNK